MKNVLIVMLAVIVLFSAFNIALPKYGLVYEVSVNHILHNVNSWVTSVSNAFGFSTFINHLFGFGMIEEIILTSESQLRLLTFEDYFWIEVVGVTDSDDFDINDGEVHMHVLMSNYPDFYYLTHSADGKKYYVYDTFEKRASILSYTDITFSEIYLYHDFQSYLKNQNYSFSDRVIETMKECFVSNSHAGGR